MAVAKEIKKKRKTSTPSQTSDGRVAPTGKRVTAKGTQSNQNAVRLEDNDFGKPSSRLVPIFMFGFFGIGVLIILLSYLPGDILPGSGNNNYYVLGGLLCICLGFVAATRYR